MRVEPCLTTMVFFSIDSRIRRSASSRRDCFDKAHLRLWKAREPYRTCGGISIGNAGSDLDNHIRVFDVYRKRLGNIGTLLEFVAALDRDGIGPDLDPFRVEPGLAVAHVEFPAVPGTA